jgi:hypothetical protein
MPAMTKIRIGDADHHVPEAVAREIEYLRGTVVAMNALRDGAVLPVAQHGTIQQPTAHMSDADFWRAHNAAARDPNTPRGKYVEYLENAHRKPVGSHV